MLSWTCESCGQQVDPDPRWPDRRRFYCACPAGQALLSEALERARTPIVPAAADFTKSWLAANALPFEQAHNQGLGVRPKIWDPEAYDVRTDLIINGSYPPASDVVKGQIKIVNLLNGLKLWIDNLGDPHYMLTHAWLGGSPATGKSHLAEAMLYYAREQHGSWQEWLNAPWKHAVRFIDWPLTMNRIEGSWNRNKRDMETADFSEESLWEPIEKAWLVVIDGVDRVKKGWSAYRVDCLYRMLQSREFAGFPTIFTANTTTSKFAHEIAAGGEARSEDVEAAMARLTRRLGVNLNFTGNKYMFPTR